MKDFFVFNKINGFLDDLQLFWYIIVNVGEIIEVKYIKVIVLYMYYVKI